VWKRCVRVQVRVRVAVPTAHWCPRGEWRVGRGPGPLYTTDYRGASGRPQAPRGRPKKKTGDPRGGWVGQRPEKLEELGSRSRVRFIFRYFLVVFLNSELPSPSPRNAQKRDKKKPGGVGFGFLVDFFVKAFRHDFFLNSRR
jgi:hypothetical protein